MGNDHDLCSIVLEEMTKLQFRPESISQVASSTHFQLAQGQPSLLQRTYLIVVLSSTLNRTDSVVPSQIRLGLNMSTDVLGWIDDLKLVLLPFLKLNEDKFF